MADKKKVRKLTKKDLAKLRGGVAKVGTSRAIGVSGDWCGGCTGSAYSAKTTATPAKPIVSPKATAAPRRK